MKGKRRREPTGTFLAVDAFRRLASVLCGLVAGFVIPYALGIYHETIEFHVNSNAIRAELREAAESGQNDSSMDASLPTPGEMHALQKELRIIRNRFVENARNVTQSVISLDPPIVIFRFDFFLLSSFRAAFIHVSTPHQYGRSQSTTRERHIFD